MSVPPYLEKRWAHTVSGTSMKCSFSFTEVFNWMLSKEWERYGSFSMLIFSSCDGVFIGPGYSSSRDYPLST